MKPCRAILWDVYGTLIAAERGDLDSLVRRAVELRAAFEQTVHNFSLRISAEHLHREFLRSIATTREEKAAAGIAHPEIRIEEIWSELLDEAQPSAPVTLSFAKEVALFFERHANPKQLMPEALETLLDLRQRSLKQGIVSNAQFYTPIELSELLRGKSAGRLASYESLFDPRLVFLSCDLGMAKPDLTGFHKAVAVLAGDGIQADECLFVGDSLANDISPARQVGMRSVLYGPTGEVRQLSKILELL